MLKVQVGAVEDSESRTLLKTAVRGDPDRGFESHALRRGLPTELPVSHRQNCVGDLFFSMAAGL